MKAVILVGGLGTRLRPLTCNTPKPMIPLVNQPFIEHMLENLRDQGITEAILAVQYLAERFREALGDGSRLGIKVHIVEEPEPRGTAGAVKNVEHMLDGPMHQQIGITTDRRGEMRIGIICQTEVTITLRTVVGLHH